MKKLLILLLFSSVLNAQLLTLFDDDVMSYFALDLDGSTEYAYVDNPTGLDLNSANYLGGDNTAFTSGIGNWAGLTHATNKATFSSTATLATSYLSTSFVSGKNYTIQLKVSSLASSDLKIKVGSDSTTLTTTGTETTKAWTFNYTDGDEIELIGNGTDTYTIDDVDVSEAYDLEIEMWNKFTNGSTNYNLFFNFYNDADNRFRFYTHTNGSFVCWFENDNTYHLNSPAVTWNAYENVWAKYTFELNNLTKNIAIYINDVLKTNTANIKLYNIHSWDKLYIGGGVTYYEDGQIGTITFTRTNGLGEVVSTSIYDWSGDSDTFLDDKGDQNNDLTGVNITTDDVVTYKGAYK